MGGRMNKDSMYTRTWRGLTLAFLPILLAACARCRSSAEPTPQPPAMKGKIVATEPIWVGAEVGKEACFYLNATDAQIAKLKEKYVAIEVYPSGTIQPQPVWPMRFDLVNPPTERPFLSRMLSSQEGADFHLGTLLPVSFFGVTKEGKKEHIETSGR